mmetsp:Transcript_35706/g.54646  ORF Transcript_35706/g.54646 Transcript_35706/m.54646 type:complete len:180 (+) Transcript_35706:452-991(+)
MQSLFSFMIAVLVLLYHTGIIMAFRGLKREDKAVETCRAAQEEALAEGEELTFDQEQVFGELYDFFTIEILVFFANLLAMPIWVIRQRCSTSKGYEYLTTQSFQDAEYDDMIVKIYSKLSSERLTSEKPNVHDLVGDSFKTSFLHNQCYISLHPNYVKKADEENVILVRDGNSRLGLNL